MDRRFARGMLTGALIFAPLFAALHSSAAPKNGSPLAVLPEGAFHDTPFEASATAPGIGRSLRYTLDGSAPTATRGRDFTGPVPIATTTVFRVAAFDGTNRVTPVVTRTFLFPQQVLRQPDAPPGLPSGPDAWNDTPSAYRMDPGVVNDPAHHDEMVDALKALPSLSVSCRMEDLFGRREGLYLHSTAHGNRWERACSVEWIAPDGHVEFQVDCGLRMQGNYGRIPEKSPKHSFRLLFKEQYGASKLKYPVFPDSPVHRFDTLVLHADYNNSWTHWNPQDNHRAQRTRDAWLKDTHRDMGGLASHNRYVHLYLNGLYWGIYDLMERPDDSFAAAYLGGNREDYDVLDESGVKAGNATAFNHLQATAGRGMQPAAAQLDLDAYIDYLLVNYYAGNGDWGEYKNWYAIRRRAPGERWRYLVWDGEMILQGLHEDAINAPGRPPFGLASSLMADRAFCRRFGDRVQRHCFGDGALTPAACIARWKRRSDTLEVAILAESARWGYSRREPAFTRDREWRKEQSRLLNRYFPERTQVLIGQLREAGLYPRIDPPAIQVIRDESAGVPRLMMQAVAGAETWYTLDGSDPLAGDASGPSTRAIRYATPVPLPPGLVTAIQARSKAAGEWSALVTAQVPARQ